MTRRITVHPSAILWLSVLGYLSGDTLGIFLLSALLHEMGHALALYAMKKPPAHITVSFSGMAMETPPLGYRDELLAAASGPAVSLLLGLFLPLWPKLGLYSVILGLFNLLPICGLDGGRILRCLLMLRLPESTAERICGAGGILTALLLLALGGYLTVYHDLGFWPLALAGALLYKALTTKAL